MKSCIWLCIAAFFAVSFASVAQAAEKVAVLGVRSLDGDTDLERRLSTALRTSAATIPGYDVSEREMSLEQMALAHGCDEPDEGCLGEIAATLAVERLLYGTVVQPPSGGELKLFMFDTKAGRTESASVAKLDPKLLAGSGALGAVSALVKRLAGQPEVATGRLRVVGHKPGTEIFVDGVSRGALDQEGVLTVELNPGKHFVLAKAFSGLTEEHMALVSAGATIEITLVEREPAQVPPVRELTIADLEEPTPIETQRPDRLRRALGWTSIGVGAAFALATIYTWVRLSKINDDPEYLGYRAAFPRKGMPGAVSDVCPEAKRGTLAMTGDPDKAELERTARKLCDEGDQLELLQYVFVGGTVLATGTGAYLLWSAKDRNTSSVSVKPRFSARAGVLEAELRF